jgi:hypothetical protein
MHVLVGCCQCSAARENARRATDPGLAAGCVIYSRGEIPTTLRDRVGAQLYLTIDAIAELLAGSPRTKSEN